MRTLLRSSLALGILLLAAPAAAGPGIALESWLQRPESVLLTDAERDILARLSAGSLDAFETWFWQRRDPTPTSAVNETRRIFRDRLLEVERRWARAGRPGWRTVPGRVFLLWGEPTLRTGPQVWSDGEFSTLSVWEYRDPESPRDPVAFFWVGEGPSMQLADMADFPATRQQIGWLDVARRAMIRSDHPGFGAPERATPRSDLAGAGALTEHQNGTLATIEIPVSELIGAPVRDGIIYSLDLSSRSADGVVRRLGLVQVRLASQALRDGDDRLQLVAWFPGRLHDGDALVLTELPTRRELALESGQGSIELAGEHGFAVRQQLATASLDGDGVALAFLPTTGDEPAAARLVVTAGELPGGLALRHRDSRE